MAKRLAFVLGALSVLWAATPAGATEKEGPAPAVRKERPRVFLRAKAWDGPSLEKIRGWMKRAEYQRRAKKLPRTTIGLALLYMLNDDKAAGKKAVARFNRARISGSSPSYSGIEAQKAAALYDWLHDHPDFDKASRERKRKHLEQWGDRFIRYLKGGGATPFYSRISGAIAGLTAIGLSLHGDSPKADEYVRYAADYLRTRIGTIREVEDGATCGGCYGYHHEFTDLANLVGAWRSATDWDAALWIRRHQGNWLERQLLFQIWNTHPNGCFVQDGDIWAGKPNDVSQYRMQIDAVTGMYRNGFGRTWADVMARRWPNWEGRPSDYHFQYIWEFFVFNDPEVPSRALAELGRTAVFSPRLHGIVCWRDSWRPDAIIIHFKCGETVDHHATYDQGRFVIYRLVPLAIKNGAYIGGYRRSHHRYYKSVWSANCVIFTGPGYHGEQPRIDFDGTPSWSQWLAARNRRVRRPPTGVLLATEANDRFARALGDFSGSTRGGSLWTRELVFLGYRYLIVLDRVRLGTGLTRHRWTLHTVNEPRVTGPLAVADNGPGRLFCRTLLPANPKLTKVGGPGHEFDYDGKNHWPRGYKKGTPFPPRLQMGAWRLDVEPADGAKECTYLHVLYPTDTKTAAMPPCSVEKQGERLVVKVGDLSHTFEPPKR